MDYVVYNIYENTEQQYYEQAVKSCVGELWLYMLSLVEQSTMLMAVTVRSDCVLTPQYSVTFLQSIVIALGLA